MTSFIKKQSRIDQAILWLILSLGLTFSVQAETDCATVTRIPQTECEALIALYNSAGGKNWKSSSGWNNTNTPCNWTGVTCSDGNVTRLELRGKQLAGNIPSELGNLTHLIRLNLAVNQLSGTIPAKLGNLSSLQGFDLSDNELTGSIPSEFGNLSSLVWLYLYSNQLEGSIPRELANLTHLQRLSLPYNQLSGSIPSKLVALSSLKDLYLNDNQLSGVIPNLSRLGNLQNLNLSNNSLCRKKGVNYSPWNAKVRMYSVCLFSTTFIVDGNTVTSDYEFTTLESIDILTEVQVNLQDIGEKAYIYIVVLYQGNFYMKDNNGIWLLWDGNMSNLMANNAIVLQNTESINIVNGLIGLEGKFDIFTGYEIQETGKLIYNHIPITLEISRF